MKKKKGLFLLQLSPPVNGVSIINELIINSAYINDSMDIDLIKINTAYSLDEVRSLSYKKILRAIYTMFNLIARLLSNHYDFVYFTINIEGYAFLRDLFYVVIIRLFRIKIIYHLHGYGVKHNAKRPFRKNLYLWFFKKKKVITLADTIYNDIKDYVTEENRFILHNAIPENMPEQTFRDIVEKRKQRNSNNLLFLSNMIYSKGPLVFLESLKQLRYGGYIFKAVFAGDWINDNFKVAFIKTIDEYGLRDYIELKGFCNSVEKQEVFINSDIFVFPTLRDTWALVILEAMRFALPIISTIEGAIPEIIHDGIEGFLVPKNDVAALTNKITVLLENRDLRFRLGDNARQHFVERYRFDSYEKNLVNILNSV